jgi:hypothetical protein
VEGNKERAEGGEGRRRREVEGSMIYLRLCENHCKCYQIPTQHNAKERKNEGAEGEGIWEAE